MNRRYSIIFNSVTGNTRKLAETIREALPQEDCDHFGALEGEVPTSQRLYIGFWTDKGNADQATLELLSKLKTRRFFSLERRASAAAKPISEPSWTM